MRKAIDMVVNTKEWPNLHYVRLIGEQRDTAEAAESNLQEVMDSMVKDYGKNGGWVPAHEGVGKEYLPPHQILRIYPYSRESFEVL